MPTRQAAARAELGWRALALLCLLAACEEQPAIGERSVCPACDPQAGGESSDFGGFPTECGAVSGPLEIDAAQAEELGYDVPRMRELLARIDAPLRWEAHATEVGEPASGYEASTRVLGSGSISSFTHVRPDPEFCDGTTCDVGESRTVEQATCPDFLRMALTVELETLDGAIHAVAEGELVQWNDDPRFASMIGDAGDHPIGHAYANLHDVTGSLQLHPPAGVLDGNAPGPVAADRGHPFPGTLAIALDLMDDGVHGSVWLEIWWIVVDDAGDEGVETYRPLTGTFPP